VTEHPHTRPVRLAVVGAGVIGRLRAQSIRDARATTLVGVADLDQARAADVASACGTAAFVDYRRLLDEVAPDALVVSTAAPAHEAIGLDALAHGCHVLIEKPLAPSVEACQRLVQAAAAASRVLAVGFNHRFYPAMQFVRRVLAEGRIGDIDHARVFGGHDGLNNFRADWMYKAELSGGGCMMDVGLHMTDLARYLVGEIVEVSALSSGRVWRVPGSEDNAMALMKTAGGVPIVYQATWNEWRGYGVHVDVYGSLGMVRAAYAPMFNLLITQTRPGGTRRRRVKVYPEIILREKLRGWQTTTRASFDGELRDFVAMMNGEGPVQLADGWSGVQANAIAQAVYRSAAEGRPVTLAPREHLAP
jgi:predicted dehydrogenase